METLDLGLTGLEHIDLIGRGGSSRVYKAWQVDHDREVAIKVINVDDDPDVLKRFDRERKAMGRLSLNEGIVPVYSSGVTDRGEPYLVMPFYPEGSLADRMARGPLRWQEAVDHLTAAARTIAAAHEADVVHLDLKPANILLSDGAPRIADFGIAKLLGDHTASRTTGASFTPAYTAPETLLGDDISPTADVYGLGATLWALIAGRPPFRADGGDNSLMAVVGRVVHQPIEDLRDLAPAPICEVIEAAMAKSPADRPATAGAFARSLAAARRAVERDSEARPNRLGPTPAALRPTPDEDRADEATAPATVRTDLSGMGAPPCPAAPGVAVAAAAASPLDPTVTPASLGFGQAVPPRFVPAVAPSGFDDALNRYGPLAAFVASVVLLVGALVFMMGSGDDPDSVPTSLQVAASGDGTPDGAEHDDETNTRSPEPAGPEIELDPAGPATVIGQTPAYGRSGSGTAASGSSGTTTPPRSDGSPGSSLTVPSDHTTVEPTTPSTPRSTNSTTSTPSTSETVRSSTTSTPRSSTTASTEPSPSSTTVDPPITTASGENIPIAT